MIRRLIVIPSRLRQNLLFNVYMLERIHYHFILSRYFVYSRLKLPSASKMGFILVSCFTWLNVNWMDFKLSSKLQHSNNIHVNFRPKTVYFYQIFFVHFDLLYFLFLRSSLKDKTAFIVLINHTCGKQVIN